MATKKIPDKLDSWTYEALRRLAPVEPVYVQAGGPVAEAYLDLMQWGLVRTVIGQYELTPSGTHYLRANAPPMLTVAEVATKEEVQDLHRKIGALKSMLADRDRTIADIRAALEGT